MKALSLYRPRILENALSEFDRYMDSFFGDNFLTPSDRIFNGNYGLRRVPAIDIRETEKSYVLEAELPGIDEKDIEIRINGNYLTLESKQAEEKNSGNGANSGDANSGSTGSYLIQERRYSSFTRSFKLPDNADPGGISASFKNGILSLVIDKKAETQQRVIQITKN